MKTNLKALFIVILFIGCASLKAQSRGYSDSEIESSPADPSSGDPGAPIDDYLIPLMVLGVFSGWYFGFKKSANTINK
jgi:hypothetical protein